MNQNTLHLRPVHDAKFQSGDLLLEKNEKESSKYIHQKEQELLLIHYRNRVSDLIDWIRDELDFVKIVNTKVGTAFDNWPAVVRAKRNGESRNASDQARKQRQDIDKAIEEAVVGLGISKENWSKLVAIKNSRNEEMHRSEIVEIVNELKLFIVDNPNLEESPALQEAIDKIQAYV